MLGLFIWAAILVGFIPFEFLAKTLSPPLDQTEVMFSFLAWFLIELEPD